MFRAPRRNRRRLAVVATAALALVLTELPPGSGPAGAAARTSASAPMSTVQAYPGPGWTTASPRTTIVFRGASAARLRPVRVTGSRTGVHVGSLVSSRAGVGAVFTPSRPFAPGEHVRVTTGERVRGAASTTYTFGVAIPVRAPLSPPEPTGPSGPTGPSAQPRLSADAAGAGVDNCRPHVWHFHTARRLHPVADCVSRRAVGTARGLILTTPKPQSHLQHGPTIYDNRGNVVWYQPMPYKQIHNLSVVRYHNRTLLALHVQHLRGKSGNRNAAVLLFNHRYRRVGTVRAQNGYEVDAHEFQVRGNAAWLGVHNPVIDPVSGDRVYEYVVQKIDIRTGDLLFEWHSLPQIKTSYSYRLPRSGKVWDYLHGNAIDPLPGGGFLLSARNTSAVYHVSARGTVVWTLGGKHDTFRIAARHPGWQFCFQHDVRAVGLHRLTVFDDGGVGKGCPRHKARVEEFAYHPSTLAVKLTTTYSSRAASSDGRGYLVAKVGSARLLHNGDLIVSWGNNGHITEFTRRHRVIFDLTLAESTYRGIRSRWFGNPTGRPAIAASRVRRHVTVYASWNGSTRVGSWQVLAGANRRHLHPIGTRIRRTGFETRLRVTTRARYVAVRAIGVHRRPLGHSRVVAPR